ncbi:hypothetical protein [Nocardioides marmotae]|uniref:Uncharacterized protein n=1 Tax=Nocardioides marmotae TaxID=2663857 RepID=A0A6I3JEX0_9ACTN|nr:hypothetical protein [Nocardioides marmotae]MCR6032988.1 hypothetical protein [Gordonia jinghuaiqii]MBC9733519.1 hypothetical protein [Nocardioides marmotae]MTB84626.1 hypothetical protein [Nocardioides marmotae]MTB96639.1 hypothetical protein [Nocardioides marmotae]QKE01851.1 hypothetical protein HPC71_12825 [Nocardioides marmotae]
MRVRRLLAAVLTTGLIAPAAAVVATAGPAAAATATQIVSGSEGRSWLTVNKYTSIPGAAVYKRDSISLSINVVDANGQQVYDGGITVQRQVKGQSGWKTIAQSDTAYLYDTIKVVGTATYRVTYGGNGTYAPSTAQGSVKAQRNVEIAGISGRKTGFEGKVSPKAKIKIVVDKKVGKKWKKFRTAATNAKGRFRVTLPAPKRSGAKFHWRITFKGSKGFAATKIKGTTYRY